MCTLHGTCSVPHSVFCVSPRVASPVRVKVCVTSWVSVSLPGRAGEKAPASRKLQDVCPRREGDPPPFPPAWTVPRSGRGGSFFGWWKFGIKRGMRGAGRYVDRPWCFSKSGWKSPDLNVLMARLIPPHTRNLIKSVRTRDVWCCRELRQREDFNEPSAPAVSSERRLSPR